MISRLQHLLIALLLAAFVSCSMCSVAIAQQPPDEPVQQPVQQQAQQGPASNVQLERSYTFDGILFVLLVGAALFVVCRSSQRR